MKNEKKLGKKDTNAKKIWIEDQEKMKMSGEDNTIPVEEKEKNMKKRNMFLKINTMNTYKKHMIYLRLLKEKIKRINPIYRRLMICSNLSRKRNKIKNHA